MHNCVYQMSINFLHSNLICKCSLRWENALSCTGKVMIEKLKWPTLEHRRKNQRLTTMFKIVHGLVAMPTTSLIPADSCTRCNHQYKFKCILASTTAYRNFFYPRTIPQWNDLDKESAEATSIDCFKSRLH